MTSHSCITCSDYWQLKITLRIKSWAEFKFHLTKGKKEKKKFVQRVTAKNMPAQGAAWFPCFAAAALSAARDLGGKLENLYRINTSMFRNVT
jgi:hypothetical protein